MRLDTAATRFLVARLALLALLSVCAIDELNGQTRSVTVRVDDPRPLASAIEVLQEQLGWIVTYEEGPWQYAGDALDVTASVRQDRAAAPRVMILRGGPLNFVRTISDDNLDSKIGVLEALLKEYHAAGYPGVFRVTHSGDWLHVIPAMTRNAAGIPEDRQPLFDVPLTLAFGDRPAFAVLQAIVAEVTRRSGVKVEIGAVPLNLFAGTRVEGGVAGEVARDLLVKVLGATHHALSWQLRCSPGASTTCYLNIYAPVSAKAAR